MTAEEEKKEISMVPTNEELEEFFLKIQERAKTMSPCAVENCKPHLAAKALWMLSQGVPRHKIRKVTGLCAESIQRMGWTHEETIESKRKDFAARYAMAANEFTDVLFRKAEMMMDDDEQIAAISPDRIATTIGILTDKAMTLNGMATNIVETRKGASIKDAAELIKRAREKAAGKIVEAEVIHDKGNG